MKKINILKNNKDFNDIINTRNCRKDNNVVIYFRKNNLDIYRIGISAGTKLGNAVTRNHLKRQIRSICDIHKNKYAKSYDYIIIVDLKSWEIANSTDKERLISHELSHIEIDDKGVLKLCGHEIEDFYSEVDYNKDNPTWKRDLATITTALYDQEKELAKAAKPLKNKGV